MVRTLLVLAAFCVIFINCARADDLTETHMNATSFNPATNTFTWQGVPTIFRTGVRLTKQDGTPLRTVNLSAYADNVSWSCVSQGNCFGYPRITSPHGTGNLPSGWHYRAPGAYIMGIFLYQMAPYNVGSSNPGTIPVHVCNVGTPPSGVSCIFSADADIYVNVNDVASLTESGGNFVPDDPNKRNNYAYDDNVGSFNLHIIAP